MMSTNCNTGAGRKSSGGQVYVLLYSFRHARLSWRSWLSPRSPPSCPAPPPCPPPPRPWRSPGTWTSPCATTCSFPSWSWADSGGSQESWSGGAWNKERRLSVRARGHAMCDVIYSGVRRGGREMEGNANGLLHVQEQSRRWVGEREDIFMGKRNTYVGQRLLQNSGVDPV